MHEGRGLLGRVRVYSIGVGLSCSTHTPWPVHLHPRAVGSPEEGARAKASVEAVSSPGFCGGWFIWCRWLPVVIVPGGGGRVPRRLRARRGYASRWRSVAGWCPYRWTHSAVATTGGVDVLSKAPVTDQLGLAQRAQSLGQSKAERRSPFDPTEATASHSDRAAP